jgi:hypothetical protein
MSGKEEFDAFTRANGLGRREDIENYPDVPAAPQYEITRQVAQELIDSARSQHPGLRPIHFDFINNPHIGAWAFRLNDGYGIGLTSGTLILVGMVFHYMLSTRSLFPKIGFPDAERSSLPPIPWNVLNAAILYGDGVMPVGPVGRERSLYALHLTQQALIRPASPTRQHGLYMLPKGGMTRSSETALPFESRAKARQYSL